MSLKYISLFICFIILWGCKTEPSEEEQEVINAVGGVRYGGTFKFKSKEKVNNVFPLSVTDVYAGRIASQIFEGLLRLDPKTLEVIPSIAEDYEVSEDLKTYTFNLRDDVYFHDDKCFSGGEGRKVTAHDFKYSFEMLCSNDDKNKLSWLFKDKVIGGKPYNEGDADEVEGIKVEDDHTLIIELEEPFSAFNKFLTHYGMVVFPEEFVEYYGEKAGANPVGTGAFMMKKIADDRVTLTRNPNYWRKDDFGNKLPFVEEIQMSYSTNKADELLSFRNQEIDLVLDIPVEEVENVLGSLSEAQEGKNVKHKVDSKASMSTQYYGFNHNEKPFDSKEVRLAFNYAIDREAIIDSWLEGEGWASNYGFVPRIQNYPFKSIKGYRLNIDKARKLLSKAGYPGGKDFPRVHLYVNTAEETGIHKLAKAVTFSLKQNLNVDVNIKLCTIEEREEAVQSSEAIFWRTGWVADYPDPENFLQMFYVGDSEIDLDINPFGFKNERFDKLFEKAKTEFDEEKRMELLAKCDQILIDEGVVMPLLTDDFITMINLKVRGFVTNELEYLDFSTIFIRELK